MEFYFFLKFNVYFYNLKSSGVLYNMQMVCNTHDIQSKVIAYDKKELKPKNFNIYWKELKLQFLKKQNAKSSKSFTLVT
jgi:hypothetical protein